MKHSQIQINLSLSMSVGLAVLLLLPLLPPLLRLYHCNRLLYESKGAGTWLTAYRAPNVMQCNAMSLLLWLVDWFVCLFVCVFVCKVARQFLLRICPRFASGPRARVAFPSAFGRSRVLISMSAPHAPATAWQDKCVRGTLRSAQ